MNYITTNIRLLESDYLELKHEAATRRKSLSAIIREKISKKTQTDHSVFLSRLEKRGKELGKKLSHFDSIKALRELRYE